MWQVRVCCARNPGDHGASTNWHNLINQLFVLVQLSLSHVTVHQCHDFKEQVMVDQLDEVVEDPLVQVLSSKENIIVCPMNSNTSSQALPSLSRRVIRARLISFFLGKTD